MTASCFRWSVVAFSPLLLLLFCSGPPPASGEGEAGLGPGPLPAPPASGGPSLNETLWKRHSTRRFDGRPVSREDLAYLLWAGSGVNRKEEKKRTAPSAWDAYAVSIYVTSPAGTSIYDPLEHALRPAGGARPDGPAGKDLRSEIPRAEGTRAAPVVLVLVADFSRYPQQARQESRRFLAHADCGAIAQNLYLAAAARGLGTVMTADARPESSALLGLAPDQLALYVLPVGYPGNEPAAPPSKESRNGKD